MQNYALQRAQGQCGKPVLLKRGESAALAEIQHRTVEPLFEGFTAEEQQRLQEYLSRMDANIQRQLKKE